MLNKFDEIGKKYNRLTVVERAENYKNGSAQWYCLCECGNTNKIKVRASSLRDGHTKSCGCLIVETTKAIHTNKIVKQTTKIKMSKSQSGKERLHTRSELGKKYPERGKYKRGSLVVRKINGIISNARKRGLDFSIAKEVAAELIVQPCHYCGAISNLTGHKEASGIDRLDNSKGYEDGNCVSCCFYCNSGKNSRSLEEFKQHVLNLYKNLWCINGVDSIKRE